MKRGAGSLKSKTKFSQIHEWKKKKRGPKSIKSDMKKGEVQPTQQKYRQAWHCYEESYAEKLDSHLGEMDKPLETYNHLRLNEKEIGYIIKWMISNKIESVI